MGATEESSVAEAQTLFDTNVWGILRTIHAVLPHMRKQRSGRIVNISSVLGFLPAPYMGLYSASKHAVEGLSETLDHEVREFGIRVSLVEPSFTKTNMETNAPQTTAPISDYDAERKLVSEAILKNAHKAPPPDAVAATVVSAALETWKMRHTPKGEASLLSKLRRFMPSATVDKGIRKNVWNEITIFPFDSKYRPDCGMRDKLVNKSDEMRIIVTGAGVVHPLGVGVYVTWSQLLAGQ